MALEKESDECVAEAALYNMSKKVRGYDIELVGRFRTAQQGCDFLGCTCSESSNVECPTDTLIGFRSGA